VAAREGEDGLSGLWLEPVRWVLIGSRKKKGLGADVVRKGRGQPERESLTKEGRGYSTEGHQMDLKQSAESRKWKRSGKPSGYLIGGRDPAKAKRGTTRHRSTEHLRGSTVMEKGGNDLAAVVWMYKGVGESYGGLTEGDYEMVRKGSGGGRGGGKLRGKRAGPRVVEGGRLLS